MKTTALAAPVLLLVYGILRLIDGRDGDHGPGLAWDLGHTAFLIAFLLFGLLVVYLRGLVRSSRIASVAMVTALLGVAAFVWVILGDLFPGVDEAFELPDPVMIAGPVLFEVGVMALLLLLAVRRMVPRWGPALVFLGFIPIAVNLDLLPLGALLILGGLWPVFAHSDQGMNVGSPALSRGNST